MLDGNTWTIKPGHEPDICGIWGPEANGPCPACAAGLAAAARRQAIREERHRRCVLFLDASATRRDVLRLIHRELRRELAPIVAHLREGRS
jgi:hypothetical protein